MGTQEARNKQLVERYWDALARRDWARMASMLAPDAHYTDVGTPGPGGTGPDGVMARLRIGLEPLSGYWHYPGHIVAEGDLVFTEHVEHWEFHTGESFDHPFVSVIEIRDGLIVALARLLEHRQRDPAGPALVARAHRGGAARRRLRARPRPGFMDDRAVS